MLVRALQVQGDAECAHRVREPLPHLRVQERQQAGARVDQVHLHAERREHARVLAADHAAPDHGHRPREAVDAQDPVGVVDVVVVVRDAGRAVRRRSGGHQDHVGGQAARRHVGRGDLDGVRVDEPSVAAHQVDPVAVDVRVDPLELQMADRVLALEEPRDRHLGIQVEQHAVQVPLPVARQEQRGLAQGLRGERARVDGGAAGLGLPLDDRDALAEVGGLGGAALAGRATPDHHQVVGVAHGWSLEPWSSRAGNPLDPLQALRRSYRPQNVSTTRATTAAARSGALGHVRARPR